MISLQDQRRLEDRRWALLTNLFTSVVPGLLLRREDVRARPFIRAHIAQAMTLGTLQVALLIQAPFTYCLSWVAFLLAYGAIIYWAIQAYRGQCVQTTSVTVYVRKPGWA